MEDQAVVLKFLDGQIFCVSHQLKRIDLDGYGRGVNNTRVSARGRSPSHNAGQDQNGGGSEPVAFAHRILLSGRFSVTELALARAPYVRSVSSRCRLMPDLYRLYRACQWTPAAKPGLVAGGANLPAASAARNISTVT